MESTVNAIFTVLGIVLAGAAIGPTYRAIKTETLLKVSGGLPSLESFSRKLTGTTYFPTESHSGRSSRAASSPRRLPSR